MQAKSQSKPSLLYTVYFQKGRPAWLRTLNRISLAGIVASPVIFFMSIFIFDNPQNLLTAIMMFLLLNSYSAIVLSLSFLSYSIYPSNKWLATALPLIPIAGYIYFLGMIFQA
ncbi:MAG TPA: hypothetical protein VN616_11755 [Puia sp.]|nr:hypothetical protein [Puia sp.]